MLGRFFDLPLHEAAVQLGISATAMKSACRLPRRTDKKFTKKLTKIHKI